MDGAGGTLMFYIITYGIVLISIVGIIRLWILRNDNQKHIATKIITALATLFTLLFAFGSLMESKAHKSKMIKLSGVYKVQRLNCEDCIECEATLINDGTYKLTSNNEIIDSGNWDFEDYEFEMQFLRTDLIFDGQRSYGREKDTMKIIYSIKSDECIKKIMEKTYGK